MASVVPIVFLSDMVDTECVDVSGDVGLHGVLVLVRNMTRQNFRTSVPVDLNTYMSDFFTQHCLMKYSVTHVRRRISQDLTHQFQLLLTQLGMVMPVMNNNLGRIWKISLKILI